MAEVEGAGAGRLVGAAGAARLVEAVRQREPATPPALRAGQVFDGVQARGPATVVLRDDRLVGVTTDEVPGALDLGDDVTLMPGLLDPHVHLAFDCSHDLVAGMEADEEVLLDRMRASAASMLAAGITTVRDLGDKGFLARRLVHDPDLPTVLSSGPPLTTPRGHCWFLGGEVDGLDAMLRAVEERAAQGCDVVKVMVSGGNITPGSSPFEPQFRLPELREVVDEAHRLGMLAAAHVHAPLCVEEALEAGFDSLEHATFMTHEGVEARPDVLERIAGSGTVVSVTAGTPPGASPPPAIAARLDQVLAVMDTLRTLGARMIPSSDGGVGPQKVHASLPWCLTDMARAGFSPVEVLAGATSRSAEALGLGGRKGELRPGADADLVAVRGDATRDVSAVHRVEAVWARGREVAGARR